MTIEELKDRLEKLPAWAREYIRELEQQAEPGNAELSRLRQEITQARIYARKLQARMDAMTEIFQCAARGGSETAQAYVDRIVNEYTCEEKDDT